MNLVRINFYGHKIKLSIITYKKKHVLHSHVHVFYLKRICSNIITLCSSCMVWAASCRLTLFSRQESLSRFFALSLCFILLYPSLSIGAQSLFFSLYKSLGQPIFLLRLCSPFQKLKPNKLQTCISKTISQKQNSQSFPASSLFNVINVQGN